jgi:hypothetical protein
LAAKTHRPLVVVLLTSAVSFSYQELANRSQSPTATPRNSFAVEYPSETGWSSGTGSDGHSFLSVAGQFGAAAALMKPLDWIPCCKLFARFRAGADRFENFQGPSVELATYAAEVPTPRQLGVTRGRVHWL